MNATSFIACLREVVKSDTITVLVKPGKAKGFVYTSNGIYGIDGAGKEYFFSYGCLGYDAGGRLTQAEYQEAQQLMEQKREYFMRQQVAQTREASISVN